LLIRNRGTNAQDPASGGKKEVDTEVIQYLVNNVKSQRQIVEDHLIWNATKNEPE